MRHRRLTWSECGVGWRGGAASVVGVRGTWTTKARRRAKARSTKAAKRAGFAVFVLRDLRVSSRFRDPNACHERRQAHMVIPDRPGSRLAGIEPCAVTDWTGLVAALAGGVGLRRCSVVGSQRDVSGCAPPKDTRWLRPAWEVGCVRGRKLCFDSTRPR